MNDGGYNVQHRVGISINLSFEWTVPLLQILTPSPISLAIVHNHVYESSIFTNVHITEHSNNNNIDMLKKKKRL